MIPENLRRVEAFGLEGGGTLAYAYLPILERLEALGIELPFIAGTSAGAIIAKFLAAGLNTEQLRKLQERTPWKKFASYRPGALYRLAIKGGLNSLDYPREWLYSALEDTGLHRTTTFDDLLRYRGTHLHVVATRYETYGDENHGRPYVFSPATTPDVEVALAVLASMAVPLFWPPVEIDGWRFCDGGIVANHPLAVFSNHEPEQILGVRVDQQWEIERDLGKEPQKLDPSVGEIIDALQSMLRDLANRAYVPSKLWDRIIRIDVGAEKALNFRPDNSRFGRLQAAGVKALETWLSA